MILFWTALPWFGLPGPNGYNDITFVAPAIDFAQGRPMSAHIVREVYQAFGYNADRWLGHPPVYQQIVGAWLRLFGVSNASMLWFEVAVCLALCGGLLALMRRFNIHWGWSIPPAMVLFAGEVRTWGMRPEATGAALLIWGVVFAFRRDTAGSFLAGMFWIGSGLVLQQAGIYTGLFFLVGLAEIAASRESGNLRWRRAVAALAGASIPVLSFLFGIGWNLPVFIKAYSETLKGAGGMGESRMRILLQWWSSATLGWEPLEFAVMVLLLLGIAAGFAKCKDRLQRRLLGAILLGLPLNIWIVRTGQHRLSFIYVLIACAAFCVVGAWKDGARWLRVGTGGLCCLAVAMLCIPGLCGTYYSMKDNGAAVRQALTSRSYSAVYFDDLAAWDVFGWQLPQKAQALADSKKLSFLPPREGELFLIQESDYQKMPLRLFGRNFRSINLNSHRWDVIDFRGDSLLTGKHMGLDLEMH